MVLGVLTGGQTGDRLGLRQLVKLVEFGHPGVHLGLIAVGDRLRHCALARLVRRIGVFSLGQRVLARRNVFRQRGFRFRAGDLAERGGCGVHDDLVFTVQLSGDGRHFRGGSNGLELLKDPDFRGGLGDFAQRVHEEGVQFGEFLGFVGRFVHEVPDLLTGLENVQIGVGVPGRAEPRDVGLRGEGLGVVGIEFLQQFGEISRLNTNAAQ